MSDHSERKSVNSRFSFLVGVSDALVAAAALTETPFAGRLRRESLLVPGSPSTPRVVLISTPYARSGWCPEAQRGMSQVGAAVAGNMMQTPAIKFSKQWLRPLDFRFLRMRRSSMKVSAVIGQSTDPNIVVTIVSIASGPSLQERDSTPAAAFCGRSALET